MRAHSSTLSYARCTVLEVVAAYGVADADGAGVVTDGVGVVITVTCSCRFASRSENDDIAISTVMPTVMSAITLASVVAVVMPIARPDLLFAFFATLAIDAELLDGTPLRPTACFT